LAEFWRCEGKPALRLSETIRHISSVAGRAAAAQAALDNATKFAVAGATEAWRQEFTTRNVRFSVIEPDAPKMNCSPKKTARNRVSSMRSVRSSHCLPRTSLRRSRSFQSAPGRGQRNRHPPIEVDCLTCAER
jgi:NAD(P)-dependent dehydrogenase (short-subunit alcohol dehydrogenase family)